MGLGRPVVPDEWSIIALRFFSLTIGPALQYLSESATSLFIVDPLVVEV